LQRPGSSIELPNIGGKPLSQLTAFVCWIYLVATALGCTGRAKDRASTLQECLIDASTKATAGAMAVAKALCHEAFPDGGTIPVGPFFYATVQGQCASFEVLPDGSLAPKPPPPCEDLSRFEAVGAKVTWTCLWRDEGWGADAVVFNAAAMDFGLDLSVLSRTPRMPWPPQWRLYRTLAQCELAITDEERAATEALALKMDAGWGDVGRVPVAVLVEARRRRTDGGSSDSGT
jgi:hypothetical protein